MVTVKTRFVGGVMETVLARARRWRAWLRPYEPFVVSQEYWDAEYAAGQWNRLRELNQLGHYSIIAGYCHYLKPGGAILDVGCGEGILLDRLDPAKYSRYVGIDLSAEAIDQAASRQDARIEFVQADARTFVPREAFDVVIFNESLYYLEDPVGVVRRFARLLKAGGILVISMNSTVSGAKIWKALRPHHTILDEVQVRHGSRPPWVVKVLVPSGAGERHG
jgi:2-polyprenyl-3-methyl-5-hydroxy-6-metoxy-1,4-benzoquinol methylase